MGGGKGAVIGGATGAAGGGAVIMAGDRNAATLAPGAGSTLTPPAWLSTKIVPGGLGGGSKARLGERLGSSRTDGGYDRPRPG